MIGRGLLRSGVWTCSYAYDCEHRWLWSARVCQWRRRWARRLRGVTHGE